MKPEIYFEEKIARIQAVSQYASLKAQRVGHSKDYKELEHFKSAALKFMTLTPDISDDRTDESFVDSWKYLYRRITEVIHDIKEEGDYRNDPIRRELSDVATALLAARRAIFWIK